MVGVWNLLFVAAMPVLKTLIITLVGLFLALDRITVLDSTARHSLNNMVFYVFGPAAMASYLAATVTLQDIIKLWFMPVNILLTFILGSLLGWALLKITRAPPRLHGLVICSCAAGNMGNLPLIIIPAICAESGTPFDDSSTCTSNGKAYATLSMAIGSVYIWSYAYTIMRVSAEMARLGEFAEDDGRLETVVASETGDAMKHPLLSPQPKDNTGKVSPASGGAWDLIRDLTSYRSLKMMVTPSNIAAIIGFAIGAISPLRNLMIGGDAPLHVIFGSSELIGQAVIPSMTLIVGANLLKGLKRSEIRPGIVLGIILVKYAVLPSMGIVVVKAAVRLGFVGSDELLYQFVLMLQFALPPAMSVGTMSELFESGQSECSVVMLWTYAVAAVFLTLWSTFFMWLLPASTC